LSKTTKFDRKTQEILGVKEGAQRGLWRMSNLVGWKGSYSFYTNYVDRRIYVDST
jgi:hypothetical protein